jgi:hypothetical protein
MLSRTATMGLSRRATAMRRQRRRNHNARLYCATNGCASLLDLDARTGLATCRICGFQRRVD